jgi:hypothetical protein
MNRRRPIESALRGIYALFRQSASLSQLNSVTLRAARNRQLRGVELNSRAAAYRAQYPAARRRIKRPAVGNELRSPLWNLIRRTIAQLN